MSTKINLKGQRFGKLVVSSVSRINKWCRYDWLCQCDCGKTTFVTSNGLRTGKTKSCGCLRFENVPANKRHGLSYSHFYKIFAGIVKRTRNKNSNGYYKYGALGIKCLWSSFDQFKDDMYASYLDHVDKFGEKETTIERVDVYGNYCKENCTWATWSEQRMNKRTPNGTRSLQKTVLMVSSSI